jgi:hypothetical protein
LHLTLAMGTAFQVLADLHQLRYFRRQNAQPQASGGADALQRLDEVPDTEDAQAENDPPTELAARLRNEPGRLSG